MVARDDELFGGHHPLLHEGACGASGHDGLRDALVRGVHLVLEAVDDGHAGRGARTRRGIYGENAREAGDEAPRGGRGVLLARIRTKGAPVNDATARGNQSAARARASGARESREARRRCCAPNVVRVTRHSRSDRIEFRARVSAERAAVYFSRRSRQPARLCRHPAPLEVERVRKRRRATVSVTRRFHRCHLKAPHPPKNIARRGRSNRRFLSRSGRRGTGFEPPVVGAIAAPPLDILRRRSRLFSRRASLHGATGDCLDARLRVSRVARTSLEPRPHPPLLRSSVGLETKHKRAAAALFVAKRCPLPPPPWRSAPALPPSVAASSTVGPRNLCTRRAMLSSRVFAPQTCALDAIAAPGRPRGSSF